MQTMCLIEQKLNTDYIVNIGKHVRNELHKLNLSGTIIPGMRIGIAFGSRGFSYGFQVLEVIVKFFKDLGAKPFVIPAMGSHGGGTSLGQLQLLSKLGITEKTLNVPIRSCVDSVLIGQTAHDVPVYCDKYAIEADGVFLFNRIKPHTSFRGSIESGLCKMMAVGLGKVKGAEALHRAGLGEHIVEAARITGGTIKLLGGLASVDNSEGNACVLKAIEPKNIEEVERKMLLEAWKQLPQIPVEHAHILIVDNMGKNISGSGMDVNVIGMHRRLGGIPKKNFETIVVLNLTPESEGNALGIGYADITTQTLIKKIDYSSMYKNALTAGFLGHVKIPYAAPNAKEAIKTSMELHKGKKLRIVRIKDTKNMKRIWISENLLMECGQYEVIKRVDTVIKAEGA